jgi:hypothetical protein
MHANGTLDDWKQHVFSKVKLRPFVLGMLSLGLAGGLVDQGQSGRLPHWR